MNSTHTGASTPRHRNDIQILRGLAVLLVLVYHSGAGIATAGYLGVDIFFVISGYLITRMVVGQIALGRFRFGDFYLRRARRLLPAAYLTLALTTIAAIYLLDYREWNDFVVQLLGALTFTGNFALWQQAGYFSGAAELKPLLHIWSLAIEEQYYLVLPLFLVFIARRLWLPLAGALALASLALHIHWAGTDPAAAFYLLPSRGWELAVGSLLALAELRGLRPGPGARLAFWPALLALIAVPLWGSGLSTPFDNVLVCAATAVVILRCHPVLATGR
ncbi:MAG: acyltransferase, partial [Gammaproteobacteria bacterium HGW-Gammaproteobacteria-7]